ncbi:MAG: DUF488 domain-containing protein [Proteobacteria bacterium]|nr:DUF488 domain-containing protein [Pseudomonadota bacterium]MDA1355514.1 DUF488 domain-containing protein [Pseudomonadota bacterium]
MSGERILHTIGHSNHSLDKFLSLLAAHEISILIDVRSWPSSRRLPHFNRAELQESATAAGLGYLWFGKELGGKNDGDTAAPAFRTRIGELAELAEREQIAMMCAEEDPSRCHRKQLLGRPLTELGVEIVHIRGDGRLVSDAALNAASTAQFSLFADD